MVFQFRYECLERRITLVFADEGIYIDGVISSHLQPMTICSKLGTFKLSNVLSDLPRRIAFIGSPIQPFHKAMS